MNLANGKQYQLFGYGYILDNAHLSQMVAAVAPGEQIQNFRYFFKWHPSFRAVSSSFFHSFDIINTGNLRPGSSIRCYRC